MSAVLPIDEALRDPNLLGAALGDAASWETWLTMLRAAYGLPLDEAQRATFAAVAGARSPPIRRVKELWAVVGRRGGKSRMAAALAVEIATLQQHRLAPGEVGYVLVLSATVAQANVVFSYARSFLERSPVLRQQLIDATRSELRLDGDIIIATHPNSFRSVRGRTLLAVIFDESAAWRDETSANPDVEVLRAVKPALIASGGMLIGISSPYRKAGLLYTRHRDCFGAEHPDILVVQGPSRVFNPQLSEAEINAAIADDPEGNVAEWLAEFRADIAAFLSDADIDACIDYARPLELPPRSGLRYRAFVDASGGRHDHFCLAIGHRDADAVVIDLVRGTAPPFDPHAVVRDYAVALRCFGLGEVVGDSFSADWVTTAFKDAGIRYLRAELPKSRLYVEGLPAFTRRLVSLPDHPRLIRELRLLERRTHAGGRDTVDHGKAGSDDYANVVFGVLHGCSVKRPGLRTGIFNPLGDGRVTEVDPVTLRPLEQERSRIKWVTVHERDVPAIRGVVEGRRQA